MCVFFSLELNRKQRKNVSLVHVILTEVEFDHIACWILLFTYILCLQKELSPNSDKLIV